MKITKSKQERVTKILNPHDSLDVFGLEGFVQNILTNLTLEEKVDLIAEKLKNKKTRSDICKSIAMVLLNQGYCWEYIERLIVSEKLDDTILVEIHNRLEEYSIMMQKMADMFGE